MEDIMSKGKMICLVLGLAAMALVAFAQTAQDHIRAGDEAYARFDDAAALLAYQAAVALEPGNYEALWKLSRANVDVADLMDIKPAGAADAQKKMYGEAESLAKKAVAANPNDTWGYFQRSAALGKRLLLLGKKEQIDGSKTVRAAIDKALALDPANDLAWHALGRWHRRIAEIGGAKRFFGSLVYGSIPKGSFEESAQALTKAVELKPEYVNHRLELGITYVALKKPDLAAAEFQKAIDLPKSSSKDDMLKAEAQAELDRLKKK
jgi:tetratricopeptide (TPR) repeat protein